MPVILIIALAFALVVGSLLIAFKQINDLLGGDDYE